MIYSDKSPWIPGLVRGLLLALIGAGLTFIADANTTDGLPGWLIGGIPLVVYGLRQLESIVLDQFRDPESRMTPDV